MRCTSWSRAARDTTVSDLLDKIGARSQAVEAIPTLGVSRRALDELIRRTKRAVTVVRKKTNAGFH